jgi:hypothetical protein
MQMYLKLDGRVNEEDSGAVSGYSEAISSKDVGRGAGSTSSIQPEAQLGRGVAQGGLPQAIGTPNSGITNGSW